MLKSYSAVCISSQIPRLAHHSGTICLLHPYQQQWAPHLWLLCLLYPPARQRAWCPSLAKEASAAQLSMWETKNRQTRVICLGASLLLRIRGGRDWWTNAEQRTCVQKKKNLRLVLKSLYLFFFLCVVMRGLSLCSRADKV